MRLVGAGDFQARKNGRWGGVPCDIDPGNSESGFWLEAQPHRGWPADFEVVDNAFHPIADGAVRAPWGRGKRYRPGDLLEGRILVVDQSRSRRSRT
jgi:hypothetical protein